MSETTKVNVSTLRVAYTSKTKRNECKNIDCTNPRQDCSARCKQCSLKYQKKMAGNSEAE